MRPKQNIAKNVEELLAVTRQFLDDPLQHNLSGLKKLLNERRLALTAAGADNAILDDFAKAEFLHLNRQQEKELEAVIEQIRERLGVSLNSLRKNRDILKKFKPHSVRMPIFVDKKY